MATRFSPKYSFAFAPQPTFKTGQKVLYSQGSGGWMAGTIISKGEKNGSVVYDVRLDKVDEYGVDTFWGYADQFQTR